MNIEISSQIKQSCQSGSDPEFVGIRRILIEVPSEFFEFDEIRPG
jgi:hypothetical protein